MAVILFLCLPIAGILSAVIAARTGRDPLIFGLGGALMPVIVVPLALRMAWEHSALSAEPASVMSVQPTPETRPMTSGVQVISQPSS